MTKYMREKMVKRARKIIEVTEIQPGRPQPPAIIKFHGEIKEALKEFEYYSEKIKNLGETIKATTAELSVVEALEAAKWLDTALHGYMISEMQLDTLIKCIGRFGVSIDG